MLDRHTVLLGSGTLLDEDVVHHTVLLGSRILLEMLDRHIVLLGSGILLDGDTEQTHSLISVRDIVGWRCWTKTQSY